WTAMRGPASMPDADGARHRALAHEALEPLQAAGGPPHLQTLRAEHGHAGAAVPAVLPLLVPLAAAIGGALVADVADDAAHTLTPCVRTFSWPSCVPPSPRASPGARARQRARPGARSW